MDEKAVSGVTSYSGDAPYIFISYAHKDSGMVIPAIRAMQERGSRIWFDLGIEVGTEWSNNIAAHLRDCAVFVAFISTNSVRSENCLDEIAYAKSHQKPSLLIFLENNVTLPEGTEMQTARFQRMFLTRQESLGGFTDNLDKSPMFDPCRGEPIAPPTATAIPTPPVNSAPAKPAGSKSKMPLFIGAAVAAVAVIALCLVLLLGKGGPSPDSGEESSNTNSDISGNTPVEMSDDLQDYTFKLDGVVYQLPFAYSKLADDGWTITSSGYSSETPIDGRQNDSFSMMKDGKRISIGVYNTSGNAAPISDCQVGEIAVEAGSGVSFEVAKGIKPGDSVDDVIAAFGTPNSRSSQDDYERLTYGDEDSYYIGAAFLCYKEETDAKYSEISLERYLFGENTTKTNEEKPAYLSTYVAPTALGDDLYAGVVLVDGDLYQLPAPVQTFLDKGWTVNSGVGHVVAGGSESLTLSRNGKKLDLSIANQADYQTTPQNCAVVGIAENDDEGLLELPGGIKLGLPKAELESKLPDTMEVYDGTFGTSYSYYEYSERDFSLSLSVDGETGLLYSIRINNGVWITN
ncbi:MAG: toll/interleukin-1 receptor domain-containing protein [Clostridia bacterium]|nr:toll/interleukin-1 receptor domain-containing protein [Clostridia bacterium]